MQAVLDNKPKQNKTLANNRTWTDREREQCGWVRVKQCAILQVNFTVNGNNFCRPSLYQAVMIGKASKTLVLFCCDASNACT